MKHTLLASTALVALTSAANAEITISGTARIGMVTTEGAAAVAVDSTMSTTAAAESFIEGLDALANGYVYRSPAVTRVATAGTAIDASIASFAAVSAAERLAIGDLRASIAHAVNNPASATSQATAVIDLASVDAIIAAMDATTSAAVAKAQDTTVGKNRVRISFAGSGTTDGGLTYGFSARADHSNTSTGGSQYISGAFGKVSMGDLNGGDEQMVGNLSGVGSSGAGSHQEFAYQSAAHNIGYSVSMAGVSFAATTDLVRGADSTKTGSNTAYGLKWSGDMGGATVGLALGTSQIGNVSEDSMSASVSMGGLSLTAVSHTNDNGPAGTDVTGSAGATGVAHVAASTGATNLDTDTTGLSISYAMDAMSVTAYTRTESTSGVADKDYSGVGFTYNLGGATLKAGFVDANDISIMDFGINFSF
jgi:outer membrane protein OmpU